MVIQFRLGATVKRDDLTGVFVSHCPSLDVYSQGRTDEEARDALQDALRLYLSHCFKRGILEEVIAKRGFQPTDDEDDDGVEHISVLNADEWEIMVPIELAIAKKMMEHRASWPV